MNHHNSLYYNWITDDIAIGELNSNYDKFDVIVNLAYINPSFNRGLNHRSFRKTYNKNQEIEILSTHFQRTINSILFRIKHLENKEHPSNIRLMNEINKKKNTFDEKHIAIEIEGL
jgi:hypothetical protein